MKACVLHAIKHLDYEDVPAPEPKTGEVLIKIRASGICGSDISRIFTKGTYKFPTIPGHEFAGEIVGVGNGVNDTMIGKAAAVFPLLPCFACDMCEVGEYASCRNYNYFGSRCDGGFAEYITVPVWNLVMAEGLSYEEMAMAEPAAVSVHALGRAGVELGDSVAIFGAGAIGLMLAAFASAGGAEKIILLDIDQKKLDFARTLGYSYVINNTSDMEKPVPPARPAVTWLEELMSITNGKGVDLAIEGAGVSQSAEGCLKAVKPLGRVVLMGNPLGGMNFSQDSYWEILRKQLKVFGTWNSSYTRKQNDWQIALDAMASGRINAAKLITHRFKLAECGKAFALLRDKSRFSCRVMFINE